MATGQETLEFCHVQLDSELNRCKYSVVQHKSLIREHAGDTQCVLGGLQVVKPLMKEADLGD